MREIKYRYIFEKRGTSVFGEILSNELWIDVGNAERMGVFDHHQQDGLGSSFDAVLTYKERYQALLHYLEKRTENTEVIFHVHVNPDMDCIASVYAIQKMLQEGVSSPQEVFESRVLRKIQEYVSHIDDGKNKCMSKLTLYAYFYKSKRRRDNTTLQEGLDLFDKVVKALERTTSDVDLFYDDVGTYIEPKILKDYDALKEEIALLQKHYEEDKKENKVILKSIKLWSTKRKCMESVKAAIWKDVPKTQGEYIFACEVDECKVTVTPYQIRKVNEEQALTRVIISVDADSRDEAGYTLHPLAEMFELCEQLEEKKYKNKYGQFRRNQSEPREKTGRFSKTPFSETSDPWYVSEEGGIVDSPGMKSIIPYEIILSIIENDSYMVREAVQVKYCNIDDKCEPQIVASNQNISLGELYRNTKDTMTEIQQDKKGEYLLKIVRLEPSLLKYNNKLLEACCLNVLGKADSEMNKENIRYLDYRTCLYVDQSITVLIIVDSANPVIGDLDTKELLTKEFCINLGNILSDRLELRKISTLISDNINVLGEEESYLKLKNINTNLVQLNVKMQKHDLVIDSISQEIYLYMKAVFGLSELKESVFASTQLLVENVEQIREEMEKERASQREKAENKRDGKLQFIMGLFAFLGIASALVDGFDFICKFSQGGEWSQMTSLEQGIEIMWVLIILVISMAALVMSIKALKDTLSR